MSPDLPRSTGCLIAPKMGINSHHIVGIKYRRHHIVGIKYKRHHIVGMKYKRHHIVGIKYRRHHIVGIKYNTRTAVCLMAPETGTNTCHYIEGTINLQCLQTNPVLLTI